MTTPTITVDLTVDSTTGAQPTPPATIWANLIELVTAINPGYTVLPAGLIEDIVSTDTYAIALIDAAAVELINSITPQTANPWLLIQQGNMVGVAQGGASNTSVFVVFSSSAVGFVIAPGVVVSDGTHQYVVQDGGAVQSDGQTAPLFCLATVTGSWAVPADTVTTIITSIPSITVTCNNPNTGTPGGAAQTTSGYRAQVLQAWRGASQGMGTYVKTLLQNVSGVQARLVSVQQQEGGGWKIIVGGGDPYAVADAIYRGLFDISNLVGSIINVTGVTNANPGVVTTDVNHGLVTGQAGVHVAGVVGMTGVNGGPYTVTVVDEKRFSFGVDTTAAGPYASGGVVTPNARNVVVNLDDYPDVYTVEYVNPPAQTVAVQLAWNTTAINFVADAAVQQLGAPAIAAYINSVPVGLPINVYAMEQAFVAAVLNLFNGNVNLISQMTWTVSINGISTPPATGTFLINGDPESYFNSSVSAITITQV